MGAKSHRRMWLLTCLLAVVVTALAGGCMSASSQEQSSEEKLPWNEPASWEGKILGAPF